MKVLDVLRQRRSIRAYADRPVEPEITNRLLEAAGLAPSAANRQPWRFVMVTDPRRRSALAAAAVGQDFVAQAPLVVVACARPTEHDLQCDRGNYPIDVTIAVTQMALQAVAEGLGTCWITGFRAGDVRRALGIPAEVCVIQMLTVGYPDEQPPTPSRMPTHDLVRWERWDKSWR